METTTLTEIMGADEVALDLLRSRLPLRPDATDAEVAALLDAERVEHAAKEEARSATARADHFRRSLLDPDRSFPIPIPKGPGSGMGSVVSLGAVEEPPPREWLVAGLSPEGAISVLAGHSGLGKSFVALLIAICVCLGRRFLGRDVKAGPVLWIDRELDLDETARRAYAICRGLGLDRPPSNLHYLRPSAPIGTAEAQAEIMAAIAETGAVLCILDSLTLGAIGDAKEQRDVVPVMRMIEQWGTTIAIDHITKGAAAGNHSSATIFGSGMKRAIVRSTFFLTPAGSALTLRPDKSNFGPASSPVHFSADHGRDEEGRPEVVFRQLDATDPKLAGAEEHATADEQTLYALLRLSEESGGAPVHISTLASERDVKQSTLRNHLSKLGDRVVKHGDNTYSPARSSSGMTGSEAVNEAPAEDVWADSEPF